MLFAETVAAVVNSRGLLWRHALRPLESCAVITAVGRIGPTTNIPRMILVMDACFLTHYTTLLTDRQKENAPRLTGGPAKLCEYHERRRWSRVVFVDTLWKLAMCPQSIRLRSNVPNVVIACTDQSRSTRALIHIDYQINMRGSLLTMLPTSTC